jgi:hypothetical protein
MPLLILQTGYLPTRLKFTLTYLQPKHLRLIFELLKSSSNIVIYEAATSLPNLSSNPAATKGTISKITLTLLIQAAAEKFIELAIKESDHNVKLIVLDKIDNLHQQHEGVIEDLVTDVLQILSTYTYMISTYLILARISTFVERLLLSLSN